MDSPSKPTFPIIMITEATGLINMLDSLQQKTVVALDIETTINKNPDRICTVQFSDGEKNYIIDALEIINLNPLRSILETSDILKLIHYANFELSHFNRVGIPINNIFDTCAESKKRHPSLKRGHGLKAVAKREVGLILDKKFQSVDWTVRPLSQDHINYAAMDVEVLIKLYNKFVPPPKDQQLSLFDM